MPLRPFISLIVGLLVTPIGPVAHAYELVSHDRRVVANNTFDAACAPPLQPPFTACEDPHPLMDSAVAQYALPFDQSVAVSLADVCWGFFGSRVAAAASQTSSINVTGLTATGTHDFDAQGQFDGDCLVEDDGSVENHYEVVFDLIEPTGYALTGTLSLGGQLFFTPPIGEIVLLDQNSQAVARAELLPECQAPNFCNPNIFTVDASGTLPAGRYTLRAFTSAAGSTQPLGGAPSAVSTGSYEVTLLLDGAPVPGLAASGPGVAGWVALMSWLGMRLAVRQG